MPGTGIPDNVIVGSIRVVGMIHNGVAMNAVVTLYDDPENWVMKQFVSQDQLEHFARANHLAIQQEKQNGA